MLNWQQCLFFMFLGVLHKISTCSRLGHCRFRALVKVDCKTFFTLNQFICLLDVSRDSDKFLPEDSGY